MDKPTIPAVISDTIAAIATPPGRGGVGIVRLSGASAFDIVQHIVVEQLEPRVASYSRFLADNGETIDHGLALSFPAPNSFTGENVIELHDHRSTVAM